MVVPEVCTRKERPKVKLLTVSRNKVAVPEGVAGIPPFWRDFVATRRLRNLLECLLVHSLYSRVAQLVRALH